MMWGWRLSTIQGDVKQVGVGVGAGWGKTTLNMHLGCEGCGVRHLHSTIPGDVKQVGWRGLAWRRGRWKDEAAAGAAEGLQGVPVCF